MTAGGYPVQTAGSLRLILNLGYFHWTIVQNPPWQMAQNDENDSILPYPTHPKTNMNTQNDGPWKSDKLPFFHMANFWGIQPLDFWGALGILIPQYRVQYLRIDEHVSHEKKNDLTFY